MPVERGMLSGGLGRLRRRGISMFAEALSDDGSLMASHRGYGAYLRRMTR